MKYTFFKDGKVEMVTIYVDRTNSVTRPATDQDHLDAEAHPEEQLQTQGITLPPIEEHLSAADKQVVQDEADAEAAYRKRKR
jgi:hypothetical protein